MKRIKGPGRAGNEGFTLVELLVVIVIISILAAIAIPVFFAQRDKALRSQVISGLKDGATIMQAWATENDGSYELPAGVGPAAASEMAWMDGEGWPPTEGVVIDIVEATDSGFCLHGTHDTLATTSMQYSSAQGAPVDGDCGP